MSKAGRSRGLAPQRCYDGVVRITDRPIDPIPFRRGLLVLSTLRIYADQNAQSRYKGSRPGKYLTNYQFALWCGWKGAWCFTRF